MEENKLKGIKAMGVLFGVGMLITGGVVALANDSTELVYTDPEPTTEPETTAPSAEVNAGRQIFVETEPSGLEEAAQAGIGISFAFDNGRESIVFEFNDDDIPVEKYSIDGGLTWNEGTPSEELLNSETEVMWFSVVDTEEGTMARFRETAVE